MASQTTTKTTREYLVEHLSNKLAQARADFLVALENQNCPAQVASWQRMSRLQGTIDELTGVLPVQKR